MIYVPAKQAVVSVARNDRVSSRQQARSVNVHAQQLFEYSPSISVKESNSCAQLTCTAAVEAGEVLVTVPESSWVDYKSIAASSIGGATTGARG